MLAIPSIGVEIFDGSLRPSWQSKLCLLHLLQVPSVVSTVYQPSQNVVHLTLLLGAIRELIADLGASTELITAGISLFVLGFATGPLIFAPLSEIYGRQIIFVISFGAFTAFNAGCAGSQNTGTLLVLRFFAGAFGSSPLTNAGGVIADIFPASQRGLAMALFALAPSFGPCASPWVAGFLSENEGWRWVMGLLAIFSGVLWILGTLFVPETYAPVILRKRVAVLKHKTGKEYILQGDKEKGTPSLTSVLATAMVRPWILLFMEPIVLLLSIYIAIVYGKFHASSRMTYTDSNKQEPSTFSSVPIPSSSSRLVVGQRALVVSLSSVSQAV